jgi:hypothetical protein
MTSPEPLRVPVGRTARRLTWPHLPPAVRDEVESRYGSPVVDAVSQDAGFTPGFASVLTCADGSRHFVKAASAKAQPAFATSYREEARKVAALPDGLPAARLEWWIDEDWVVLGLEHVAGRAPARPWRSDELDVCLDALEVVADRLTPAPADLDLDPVADELGGWAGHWTHVRATRPGLPHLEEAAELARSAVDVMAGETLVHTDVRDDNLLLTETGAVLCDWNWPVHGAAWLDTLFLLIGPRGDGLDADAALASRRLTANVPADHVDAVLALVAGYFFKGADDPVPPTSPHLRDHQAWCRDVTWAWLRERRGW